MVDAAKIISPEFGEAVAAIIDSARRRRIARRAVEAAVNRTGIAAEPVVRAVLAQTMWGFSSDIRARAAGLAEEFDRGADAANLVGDEDRYDDQFMKARAATALTNFVSAVPDGMLSDTLYEAFHAVDNDETLLWEWIQEP